MIVQIAVSTNKIKKASPSPFAHASVERLDENLGAAAIALTSDDLPEVETAAATITVHEPCGTGREQYM
jgi:aryl-alcohol dehydrogenase-like predicted oxidoreductase